MNTTLADIAEGVFLDTTHVNQAVITVLRSEEYVTLGPNGAGFGIAGEQRMLWAREQSRGEGRVDADVSGAICPNSWLGAPMEQKTFIEFGFRAMVRVASSDGFSHRRGDLRPCTLARDRSGAHGCRWVLHVDRDDG